MKAAVFRYKTGPDKCEVGESFLWDDEVCPEDSPFYLGVDVFGSGRIWLFQKKRWYNEFGDWIFYYRRIE
ncbi:MAG: hypothetical protein IT581_12185 [Verrucomicrobiales bacterium]|nr:hypothetical protein [Verrucomicrobiales bacterium]